MLINNQKKLEAVLDHVENGLTIKDVSIKYHIDSSRVKYFVKLYRTHGKAPFEDRDKRYVYTRELKLKAINDFITGEFSGRQIGINLGLISPDIVNDWVNLYKDKGEAAIVTTYGRKNYELKEDKIKRLNNKEAEERIKYLEAENEALKKFYALIQKKEKISKKKLK